MPSALLTSIPSLIFLEKKVVFWQIYHTFADIIFIKLDV